MEKKLKRGGCEGEEEKEVVEENEKKEEKEQGKEM